MLFSWLLISFKLSLAGGSGGAIGGNKRRSHADAIPDSEKPFSCDRECLQRLVYILFLICPLSIILHFLKILSRVSSSHLFRCLTLWNGRNKYFSIIILLCNLLRMDRREMNLEKCHAFWQCLFDQDSLFILWQGVNG